MTERQFVADFDWRKGMVIVAYKAGHDVPDDPALVAAAEAAGALGAFDAGGPTPTPPPSAAPAPALAEPDDA